MIMPSDLLNPTGKAGSALVSWAVYAYLEFVNGVNLNTNQYDWFRWTCWEYEICAQVGTTTAPR